MKLNFEELLIVSKLAAAEHDMLSHEEEVYVKNYIHAFFNEEYEVILKRDLVEHFINIVPEDMEKEYGHISSFLNELREAKNNIGENSDIPAMLSSRRIDDMISILMEDNQYCTNARQRDRVEFFIKELNDVDQNILKNVSVEIPDLLLKKVDPKKIDNLSIDDQSFLKKIKRLDEKSPKMKM